MIYLVSVPRFIPILAFDLTVEQLANIAKVKATMSHDGYAGYSPDEQAKYQQIQNIVGAKQMSYEEV